MRDIWEGKKDANLKSEGRIPLAVLARPHNRHRCGAVTSELIFNRPAMLSIRIHTSRDVYRLSSIDSVIIDGLFRSSGGADTRGQCATARIDVRPLVHTKPLPIVRSSAVAETQ